MQTYTLPRTDLVVSRLAYGCMQIGGRWDDAPLTEAERQTAFRAIQTALDAGITLFDHADIYTRGKSESVFGDFLKSAPGLRPRLVLQTKCGIRFQGEPAAADPQRYDFSYSHIVRSVETSLRRLQTDYLDLLLLHRPDPLVEPEEVARAFAELHAAGKVRYFGVSNHTPAQIELLQAAVAQPLVVNQLELSLTHSQLMVEGVVANRAGAGAASALAAGTLDYCRLRRILVQAWAPLAGGQLLKAGQLGAALIAQLAEQKQTSPEAIAVAWLLRHPAGIQPILGSTRPERIRAASLADTVSLSREEWYALLGEARGQALP